MIKYQSRVPALYLHNGATNMSKSFKGLLAVIAAELQREPKDRELFVFFNRARNKAKVIFKSTNGYTIVYKALTEDYFRFAKGEGYKKLTHVNPEKFLNDIGDQIKE